MRYTDQIGRSIEFSEPPKRIVSLVPSQTELLFALGLESSIVGITKFCIYPQKGMEDKTIVGGTKTVHFDRIAALSPDVILCNKEENTKEMVEELSLRYTVHVSDIASITDALDMILQYGVIFNKKAKATSLIAQIKAKDKVFRAIPKSIKRVAYFIWKDPWMVAGGNTFINHMLMVNGFDNVFKKRKRYPEVTIENLVDKNVELILLSSEPFPFKNKHISELKTLVPKETQIQLVDGTYFSWYGSRINEAFDYFRTLR